MADLEQKNLECVLLFGSVCSVSIYILLPVSQITGVNIFLIIVQFTIFDMKD